MTKDDIVKLHSKYPFLTGIRYAQKPDSIKDVFFYVGVVHNSGKETVSLYDLAKLKGEDHRKAFISVGDKWWRESNRLMPMGFFLPREELEPFRYALVHLTAPKVSVFCGELPTLDNFQRKRSTRRPHQVVVQEE